MVQTALVDLEIGPIPGEPDLDVHPKYVVRTAASDAERVAYMQRYALLERLVDDIARARRLVCVRRPRKDRLRDALYATVACAATTTTTTTKGQGARRLSKLSHIVCVCVCVCNA